MSSGGSHCSSLASANSNGLALSDRAAEECSSNDALLADPAASEDGVHASQSSNKSFANAAKSYRNRTQAWWTVGEYLESGTRTTATGLTHQSAKFSLTGSRVFANQKEELWDLSDSLIELYEAKQKEYEKVTMTLNKNAKHAALDPAKWLRQDSSHGFIRVYAPNTDYNTSQLIPCTLSTSAHKICLTLGISLNALHVQMGGDIISRLDPYEHPLMLQNKYLAGLGYSDISRIQEQGCNEDLGFLIRFYAGKPFHDSTFSRNQLVAWTEIRKSKVISQWVWRLCVLSGTRLLLYKDKQRQGKPSVIQLAKGSVEEIKIKGHDLCLKVTSTLQGEKCIYLSFMEISEYNRWYKKCKKATDKLPTTADLSGCHLEFLPETIFINDQLEILNLRHNVLRERPLEEDIYTIGWLEDLPRFSKLRSLNLADNNLMSFPTSICQIRTLVELNLACNKLEEIPTQIGDLRNLQALHLHNNHLSSLPDDILALRKLFVLILAFNRFTSVPLVVAQMTDVRVSEIENVIMAGNKVQNLPPELLFRMKYAKKIDFRMNNLVLNPDEAVQFSILEHLTHLDIRDNYITELDIRPVKTLEYLNCERNALHSLQVNGLALKNLFASHNEIERIVISPKPEWLLNIDLSYNQLRRLPEWLSDCFFLQKLNVSHNVLVDLPSRLFLEATKLKILRANHNRLSNLPNEVDTLFLEELHLEHNFLTKLPLDLLRKANKLRILNVSRNRLTILPPLNESHDLNKVQELYLSGNCLNSKSVSIISGYARLKVLHLAANEITDIEDSDIYPLELLQELNVSGNQLRSLPAALGKLSKLAILRAHSNLLNTLPDFKKANSLKELDVGHNQLLNVSVTSLMASQINLLDMSLNAQLKVDPLEFRNIKNQKTVCLVDLTGQDRALPGLSKQPQPIEEDQLEDANMPWKVGFAETAGIRNKLCVNTLKVLKFGNDNEAVFAMFDGGYNNEVPKIMFEKMPDILRKELSDERATDNYMKYALLSAHSKLRRSGQKLGASCVLCHVNCSVGTNNTNYYTLQLANVGDVEVVLCRRGTAHLLSKKFSIEDREEADRIINCSGIITEDNKVNGSTKNSRVLGCAYLYPHLIPDPYTNTVGLKQEDEFMIIGNQGLWHYVGYDEAVQEVYETGNPVVAAKKLQDLAQGYGSKENIAILVIRFNTDSRPSLCKLRPHKRSMSIDDIEAAARHEENKIYQQNIQASKQNNQQNLTNKETFRAYPSAVLETSESSLESDVTKSLSASNKSTTGSTSFDSSNSGSINNSNLASMSKELMQSEPKDIDTTESTYLEETKQENVLEISVDINQVEERFESNENIPEPSSVANSSMLDDATLKPLPNQRYLKKDAAGEWESILQKRLVEQVKSKELKQIIDSSQESLLVDAGSRRLSVVEIDAASTGLSLPDTDKLSGGTNPIDAGEHSSFNPLKSQSVSASFTMNAVAAKNNGNSLQNLRNKQPKVKNTIAMFENMNPADNGPKRNFIVRQEPPPCNPNNLTGYRPNRSNLTTQSPDTVNSTSVVQSHSSCDSSATSNSLSGSTTYYSRPISAATVNSNINNNNSSDDTLCDSDGTVIGSSEKQKEPIKTDSTQVQNPSYPRPVAQNSEVIENARL